MIIVKIYSYEYSIYLIIYQIYIIYSEKEDLSISYIINLKNRIHIIFYNILYI